MLSLVSSALWCTGDFVCRVSLSKAHSAAAAWRAGVGVAASWHFENTLLYPPFSSSTALLRSSVTALITGFELVGFFPTLPVLSPSNTSQI